MNGKPRTVAFLPLVECDCGHKDQNPNQYDEHGRKRNVKLCQRCHELILSRDMRLELMSEPREREE